MKWLDRHISAPGPYLCLCRTKKEYAAAVKHLNAEEYPSFLSTPQADATTHIFTKDNKLTLVVCLGDCTGRDPLEVVGLLVHEAVHVWQQYCQYYGEHSPGTEQEAYAIQAISQELLGAYRESLK